MPLCEAEALFDDCDQDIDGSADPVPPFTGIRQRRTSDRFTEPHAVKFARLHREADRIVAKAFPTGQLRKRHRAMLLGTRMRSHTNVSSVPRNNPGKLLHGTKDIN